MLGVFTVKRWRGPSPQSPHRKKLSASNTEEHILNTKNMFNIQDDSTLTVTTTSLYYVENLYGIQSHGNYMELDEAIATVRTVFDQTFEHEYVTLPVFPNDDITQDTEDRDIPAESITDGVAYNPDDNYSWIWYSEGEKTIRVLVDYDLDQIVDVCDTGTTTTTSTTSTE